MDNFTNFNFEDEIQLSITKNNFTKTTAIQNKVIPLILKSTDVVAKAQTGSGKTASFVLPILQHIINNPQERKKKRIKALILTPTRELSLQVASVFEDLMVCVTTKLKVVSLIGGEQIGQQLQDIQQGCEIVVATSGRLLDILGKQQINLDFLDFFVLDEADKMLDLGFELELDEILKNIPKQRQNLLFSASYPQKMQSIVAKVTTKATKVSEDTKNEISENINQKIIMVNSEKRGPLLRVLLKKYKYKKILVFMANKRASDNISNKFRKHGLLSESFHGGLEQEERVSTLKRFKEGKTNILFCTDIAARGLHIQGIDCVVNYDLPRSPYEYIHRIGRTARAGEKGDAVSFVDYETINHFNTIKKKVGIVIETQAVEGFEILGENIQHTKGKEPIKGKRKSKKDKLREMGKL